MRPGAQPPVGDRRLGQVDDVDGDEVRPLVLERQPQLRETPKANGLGGQILQLLQYRGLLDRFGAGGPSVTY
jgi:hypothetical protein